MHEYFKRILAAATVILIIALAAIPVVNAQKSTPALSRYGSTGTEVKNIQTVLKRLGYYTGSIDGIYGSGTKSAVTRFQRDCGLTQDGICGPVTLLYLGLDSGSSSSAGGKYSSSDVALLAKEFPPRRAASRTRDRLLSAPLCSIAWRTLLSPTLFRVWCINPVLFQLLQTPTGLPA